MQRTKEMRWFLPHEVPELNRWLDRCPKSTVEQRTDYYLELHSDDIGIKIRQGNIEIKKRTSQRSRGCLNDTIWGCYDHFEKWSFEGDTKDAAFLEVVDDRCAEWVPVSKSRKLVQLTQGHEAIMPTTLNRNVDYGCQVEYAEIEVYGERWYTVGLEWFGNECMELDARTITNMFGNTKLHMTQSHGYPSFLAKLGKGQRNKLLQF